MSIDNILAQATADAVKALYGAEVAAESIVPSTTKKEFEGNLTIVVFPFLKASHTSALKTQRKRLANIWLPTVRQWRNSM